LKQLKAGASIVALVRQSGVSYVTFCRTCVRAAKVLPLYPGVPETLAELARRRVPCAIVTNLPGRVVEPLLRELGMAAYFPVVIHSGNVRARKPHPRPLLEALRRMAIPQRAGVFYVGDLPADAEAARRAGVAFAWAAYGYGDSCPPSPAVVLRAFPGVLKL